MKNNNLTLEMLAEQQHETEQVFEQRQNMVLEYAKQLGADETTASFAQGSGYSVEVRNNEVETVTFNNKNRCSINVEIAQCKGTVSLSDVSEGALKLATERAVAMAKYAEADPWSGLADKALIGTPEQEKDFDIDHPNSMSIEQAIEKAKEAEQVLLNNTAIKQSEGTSVSANRTITSYSHSKEFLSTESYTSFSLSGAALAEHSSGMVTGSWWDSQCLCSDTLSPLELGHRIVEETLDKVSQGKARSGKFPVIFSSRCSADLYASLLSGVSGRALYRKSSFLLDSLGTQVLPKGITVREDPWLKKNLNSSAFDSDTLPTFPKAFVSDGILDSYILSVYSARRLSMKPTHNGGGTSTVIVDSETETLEAMMKRLGTGFYVTGLMGQGKNLVTGDYSRGASGFWFEQGEIQHYVEETTIAGNLKEMLLNIIGIADDVDFRTSLLVGSTAVEGMTIAAQ